MEQSGFSQQEIQYPYYNNLKNFRKIVSLDSISSQENGVSQGYYLLFDICGSVLVNHFFDML